MRTAPIVAGVVLFGALAASAVFADQHGRTNAPHGNSQVTAQTHGAPHSPSPQPHPTPTPTPTPTHVERGEQEHHQVHAEHGAHPPEMRETHHATEHRRTPNGTTTGATPTPTPTPTPTQHHDRRIQEHHPENETHHANDHRRAPGGTTPGTTPTNPIAAHISRHPHQAARIERMLPAGMTLNTASAGFRNQGQFIAALHASRNLHIPFADLKRAMTGPNAMSLGEAIHTLRPSADANAAARRANTQAHSDVH